MKEDITGLYCFVDEFTKFYQAYDKAGFLPSNKVHHGDGQLSFTEMLGIS